MSDHRCVDLMLHTPSIRETQKFYTEILGFQVAGVWPEEGEPVWTRVQSGEVRVMFYHDKSETGPAGCTGTLYFNTPDVKGYFEKIKGKVEVLFEPHETSYQMLECAIKDNNGYVLTFGSPTEGHGSGG